MTGTILVINAGSSSVKFSLFENRGDLKLLSNGQVADIGGAPVFSAGDDKKSLPAGSTHEDALRLILGWIEGRNPEPVVMAAHRVVHGGTLFHAPVRITAEVLDKLRGLNSLAPLHQPHNL